MVGATSGIGRACALSFARHGCRLVIAARNAEELIVVAAMCRELGAGSVATCGVDIGCPADVERVTGVARDELEAVDVWVNVAAVLAAGDLTDSPVADLERIVATNVLGVALTTRAALGIFDGQGWGTLINVSSLLGVVPNPLVPAYCMTKFAVRGLTITLQRACRPRSVAVCLVLPGPVDTPMFTHAANHTGRPLRAIPPAASPWRVAQAVVRCVCRPRRVVTVGVTGWGLLLAHRIAPRPVEWAVARVSAAFLLRSGRAAPTSGNLTRPDAAGAVVGGFRRSATRRRLGDRLGGSGADGSAPQPVVQDGRPRHVGAAGAMDRAARVR